MPKQIVIPEEQLKEKFLQACQIIEMLRRYKKIWDEEHGSRHRNNLRRWEENADKFLDNLTVEETESQD